MDRLQWLREMGYQPLRLRPQAAPVAATNAPTTGPLPASAGSAAASAPPLWQALLRACEASSEDVAGLGWELADDGIAFAFAGPRLRIDPTALRADPQAKRQLWRTLRALRRQRCRPA